MTEFNSIPLADYPLEIIDGDRGKNYPKTADFKDIGYCLFLNAGNVTALGFNFANTSFISKQRDDLLNKGKLKRYDVILTTRGTVGNLAFFSDSVPYSQIRINSGMVILRANSKELTPEFLHCALRSPQFKKQVIKLTSGSAQPQLPIRDIKAINLPLPNIKLQKQIVSVVNDYDNKIELNRKMNATLEAMAQAIFKDWFVDFGPTRRKQEARKVAGLSGKHKDYDTDPVKVLGGLIIDPVKAAPIANLFPDSFNDEGLPAGWTNIRTEELSEKIAMGPFGSNIKVSTFVESGVPIISGHNLHGLLMKEGVHKFITKEHADKLKNSNVFAGDIVFTHAGNIGQVSLIEQSNIYERFIISQRQFYLRPNKSKTNSEFLVYFFRSHLGRHLLLSNASQVGVPSIARPSSHLKSIEVVSPSFEIMSFFKDMVRPLIDKITANTKENQSLAETRDYLLPKLMSGEVRVWDAVFSNADTSNVVGLDKDLFGRKQLPADQASQRDAVMVAAIIDLFDSDGYVVGNFRYQKGIYFLKRYLDLPQATTTKQAAGPYDSALRYEGGHKIAQERRYIREAFINGKTGNKRGSKIAEAKAQIDKFGLAEGLKWGENNLRFKSDKELECLATVDFAMNELRARGSTITVDAIIQDINRDDVWRLKLTKAHFRRDKIRDAVAELNKLFGTV